MGVLVEGTGSEAIVMIHGWPDTHRLWQLQVEALRAEWCCIRFTLPGFELHQTRRAYSLDEVVEAIRGAIEQICPGRQVTLLLHDWGCFFGDQFAMRYPRLVKRVIGVDIGDAGSRRHLQGLSVKAKAMLFIYGKRKPLMFHSSGWAEEIAARPGSQVIGFDAGHWVMLEMPEEFDHTVVRWLASCDAMA